MKRKIIAVFLAMIMLTGCFCGCNKNAGISALKGAHVFMFKNTGNAFGDLMFAGFSQVVAANGGKAVYKSPAEPSIAAQVEMLDTLVIQQVASITISTCGDTGYEEVFKRAKAAGIKIVSVDNMASPDYRTTHINECDTQAIGSALVQAATLIALGIDYPADGDLETATVQALAGYTGKELVFGVLSSSIDTPVQNGWIECMRTELKKAVYAGKVNPNLDVKYGNDEPTEATNQANAFVAENKVDMIISPTTVGLAAAGQVLKSNKSKIKLTGLGLPHEMQGFMPAKPTDNAFDYVCPYMLLWDVRGLGAAAGAATMAACYHGYAGSLGETFTLDDKTYTTISAADGGTRVIALDPYVFYKENMADWIDVL